LVDLKLPGELSEPTFTSLMYCLFRTVAEVQANPYLIAARIRSSRKASLFPVNAPVSFQQPGHP
jgi:hypothetical protein